MQIYEVTDPLFKEYGKIIDSVELTELLAEMKHTPVPEDVVYVASEPKLEALAVMKELTDKTYGELPIQIGYCNGHNRKLNALEYHRSSEVDVAATELVLMLGKQQDITEEFTYDTSKVKAFQGSCRDGGRAVCDDFTLCTLPYRKRRIPVYNCTSERNEPRSGKRPSGR